MKNLVGLFAAVVILAATAGAATHTVNIVGFAFNPGSLTIQVGDSVTWVQQDQTQHTTTSDSGVWSSPLLFIGQSFTFTFNQAGSYPYFCSPHPNMTGTIIVEAPVSNPVVGISSPSDSAIYTAPGEVALQATVEGDVTRVQFFNGATSLGTSSNTPFSLTVDNLPPGTNQIRAVAFDGGGNSGTSAVVRVIMNLAPLVTITNPISGDSFTAPATVTLTPELRDTDGTITSVAYYADGTNLLGTATTGDFSFTLTDLPAGEYEIMAMVSDDRGAMGHSETVTFSITPPVNLGRLQGGGGSAGLGALNFSWDGGLGPYALQRRDRLSDPIWQNVTNLTGLNAALVPEGESGFFRVMDRSHPNEIPLTAFLSGLSERPTPITNSASGSGILAIIGDSLVFNITYQGLSGPVTGTHIHGPSPASTSAGVLINLAPYAVGELGTTGRVAGVVTLTPTLKRQILTSRTYVNFHTANNPGGEVRGQILPMVFHAHATGEAERPTPVFSSGSASGIFILSGNQLSYHIAYRDLTASATASHIHGPATLEQSAGIMVGFNSVTGTEGVISGSATLTPAQLAALGDGLTYLNIHTTRRPGGEIRGQILPRPAAFAVTAPLNGDSERPNPVTTTATGMATMLMEGNELHGVAHYSGLSAPFTGMHIHGAAPATANAGVIINLAPHAIGTLGTNGVVSIHARLTPAQKAMLLDGRTYANVHSTNFPSGEIRGQLAPTLYKVNLNGLNERPTPVITPARGHGLMTLVHDRLDFNLAYRGLRSDPTAAHIHGPAGRQAFTGVMIAMNADNFLGGLLPSGGLVGSTPLTAVQRAALVDGLTYFNVHTQPHPSGEIRGQILP